MSRSEHVPTSSVECFAVEACMALAAFVYLPLAFMARVVMGVMTVPGHTQFGADLLLAVGKAQRDVLGQRDLRAFETV